MTDDCAYNSENQHRLVVAAGSVVGPLAYDSQGTPPFPDNRNHPSARTYVEELVSCQNVVLVLASSLVVFDVDRQTARDPLVGDEHLSMRLDVQETPARKPRQE